MPITSYTGLPGHGKTTLMMEHLLSAAKKADRPLFAAGIDGLEPGIATILDDPLKWNDFVINRDSGACDCDASKVRDREGNVVDHPRHDHTVVPDGALIFIDEAWKWFGHLQNATRQATPAHVLGLAEHRHRGIDFVWTYQQPCQIYPFARGLCAEHYHVVRRFGTKFVDVFKWEELNEETKSQARRDAAQRTTRTLPADVWKSFKSATIHTIKARIPLKVMLLPAMFVAAAGLLYFAYASMKPAEAKAHVAAERPEAASAAPASIAEKRKGYDTLAAYVEAHQPRIPTMPWSAPVFDQRRVVSDPQLYCAMSGAGEDAQGEWRDESCTCITEQGTPYKVTRNECAMVARQGAPYNPYRDLRRQSQPQPQSQRTAEATRSLQPAGVVLDADQVTGYGDMQPESES